MDFPQYIEKPQFFLEEGGGGRSCEGLRIPRLPSQNIVNRLCGREMWGGYRKPVTATHLQRSMYQSIYPNFTVTDVVKPPGSLGKFTPDGKDFIMISVEGRSLEVYQFRGAGAANSLFLLKGAQWEESLKGKENASSSTTESDKTIAKTSPAASPLLDKIPSPDTHSGGLPDRLSLEDKDMESIELRKRMFEKLFKLKFRIPVAPEGETLRSDCTLFTEDLKYMITGSASPRQAPRLLLNAQHYDIYRNNESVEPNPKYCLQNYSIHLVDIQCGILADSRHFKLDKIYIHQNHGLSLFQNKLSILSVQHQTIHILLIKEGKFLDIQRIGRFCHEDGELVYSQVAQFRDLMPKDERFMNDLKHRMLAHLFRRAYEEAERCESPDLSQLSIFRQYYDHYLKFRLCKAQLLDQDHLLLKYTSEDFIACKSRGESYQHSLFVFYNIERTEVLAVYENTTEAIVELFQSLADHFMDNFLTPAGRYVSTPSNNLFSKELFQELRRSLATETPTKQEDATGKILGGPGEALKRLLAPFPINAQSVNLSPYLDEGLFAYDKNRISPTGQPKFCGESPIKFHGRESKARKFQLQAGITEGGSSGGSQLRKPVVASIFHPSAPFAISVETTARGIQLTHFHLRIDPHSVMPLGT